MKITYWMRSSWHWHWRHILILFFFFIWIIFCQYFWFECAILFNLFYFIYCSHLISLLVIFSFWFIQFLISVVFRKNFCIFWLIIIIYLRFKTAFLLECILCNLNDFFCLACGWRQSSWSILFNVMWNRCII
jgi:hypothetical protein